MGEARHRHRLRAFTGYVVAGICLAWVLRDVHTGTVWQTVRQMRWSLVVLAVAFDILSYVVQGFRWRLLLRPVGSVSWVDATQAIYAGLFVNEILPMRPGEFLRALVLARRLDTDVTSVLPSIMVERLFDGIWLALGIGVAAMTVPLPPGLLRAGDVLGLLILLGTGLFLYIVFGSPRPRAPLYPARPGLRPGPRLGRLRGPLRPAPLPLHPTMLKTHGGGPGRRLAVRTLSVVSANSRLTVPAVVAWLNRLRSGAREIGVGRTSGGAFVLSLALLVSQILAFWLVMRAYGLEGPLLSGAVTLIVVHLGTAVPNAPANVGTYQFFCVVGLMLFGFDRTTAGGFSVIVFVILTLPLWLLGSVALGRTGVTIGAVRGSPRSGQ